MRFKMVADFFEKLSNVSARNKMTELLAELFKMSAPEEAKILSYISLGRLHPPYIGTQFNLAEKNMIKIIAELLNKSDKEILKEYKERGDFGLVLEGSSWQAGGNLSLSEVYQRLSELEKISGEGSHGKKISMLINLLKELDPISAKYVIKIILGNLRLGFSDMTIIDALSWMEAGSKKFRPDLERAYNTCANLGRVAYILKKDGMIGVKEMRIVIGIPIMPAAAERLPSAKAIFDKVGVCVAEPKLDGFRLQVHMSKKEDKEPFVKFFSRNLLDMSYMFPDILKEFLKLEVENIICEGEAIAYDENTGHFLPFQETVKRKRKHGIEQMVSEYPLKVFLFDLLYLNGESLLDKPYHERRQMLLNIFKDFKGKNIEVNKAKKINSAEELERYFIENIDAGLEGLVVKRINSIYQPGKRNFNWIKLKRQEEGKLEDTIDSVILGYYYGAGRRADFGIGAFLVGVYNKEQDSFQTTAKVGTGLKDDQWRELKKKCDQLKVPKKPVNIDCAKELYPDVWVYPKIVVLIRADEITLSPLHTAGKTKNRLGLSLRFPRFMGYRPDKSVDEATTVLELQRLFKDQY